MPIIQISQIVLRSGPSIDLPGAPTSTNPIAFSPGLLAGEMAFMEDTGRIYVGHSPTDGQPNYQRLAFPYQNIEVLTENSTDTLNRLIGSTRKEEGEFAFNIAQLPIQTVGSDWQAVVLPRPGDSAYTYRIPFSGGVCATMDYAAYDPAYVPLKVGRLTVSYFPGEGEPNIVDEATTMRRTDLTGSAAHRAADVFQQVDLRFAVAGPQGAQYLELQYKNSTASVVSLRFKTSKPKA